MPKPQYGKTALKSTKQFKLKVDFLERDIRGIVRKEIQQVFHAANRRIENIEKSGVYSPAYQALKGTFDDRQNFAKFAKFSMSGLTDAEIKIEYAKAISFLQKPTSTASGAKTFEKHTQRELDLTDTQFDAIKSKLLNKNMPKKESEFAQKYLTTYKGTSAAFESAVKDVSEQMESDARKIVSEVENAQTAAEQFDTALKNVMDAFKRFGF